MKRMSDELEAAAAAARLARILRERLLLDQSFGLEWAMARKSPVASRQSTVTEGEKTQTGPRRPDPAHAPMRAPPGAPTSPQPIGEPASGQPEAASSHQSTLDILGPEPPVFGGGRFPRGLSRSGPAPASIEPPPEGQPAEVSAAPPAPTAPAVPKRPAAPEELAGERKRRQALLDPIHLEVRACRACVLCEERTQAVFGVGDPCARLLFIGEGPGEDEDRQGEPFVGKAGQLLTRMIQAMGLARKDVYIANIVKCRPPGNRNPAPREVISCLPYLKRQIEIIDPDVICVLGNVATRSLLDTQTSISRLRGRFTNYQEIPVLPTFHPSYLLRNPEDKRLVWEDLRKLMVFLGLPDPTSSRESSKGSPERG